MKLVITALLLLFSSATAISAEKLDFCYFHNDFDYYEYSMPGEVFRNFMKPYGTNYQQAFFDAASAGRIDIIKTLLAWTGVQINKATNQGKTALMYAAEHGHTATCALLIKHGAQVNARTNWGSTSLMWAAQNGHREICRLLVQHGAMINATTDSGKTALDYAKGHRSTCDFLYNAGAKFGFESYRKDLYKDSKSSNDGFCAGFIVGSLVTFFLDQILK